jgi:two-component system CheB/CheR fusion protein
MNAELRSDGAEQDFADQVDDLVPSYGYQRIPVVGLGGSAGSIEALQEFFTTMPPRSGLAFVVVIHLSPEHESLLPEVIQRCTRMPVVKVDGTLEISADTVYVIPPGRTLQFGGGSLRLGAIPAGMARHVVVDILFRTLADSHAAHAAAVVLSGMDGDGSVGIKRVKERGGLTVAQDPAQAMHGGMPRSAISTGMVDWVLPVQEMPARLLSYFRLEGSVALPPEEAPADPAEPGELHESQLQDVLAFVRTRTGRDFTQYKRATVLRRIGRRMQVNGVDNLHGYLTCLRTRPGECAALLQDLLISVTNFFRDEECFAALQEQIPKLFEGKGPHDVVRVWVIACATGEEAYSMAMLLNDHARTLASPPLVQVFATDLDQEALQVAREGVYPAAIAADVSEDRLRRFFVQEHRGWRIRRDIRETVLFAVHDVLRDAPFSRVDLVSCRNLLIYLTREAQGRVFEAIHFSLVPQGLLFLGSSESVDESSPFFGLLDKKHRIYRQRPASRAGLPLMGSMGSAFTASTTAPREIAGIAAPAYDPAPGLVAAAARQREPRSTGWADMHLQLLERLAPPSLVVNADHDIVHLSPSAGRFLQMGGGEPSRNLLKAVPPEVRLELRAALHQAAQRAAEVQVPPMNMPLAGGTATAMVRVIPAMDAGEALFLVLFDTNVPGGESAEDRTVRLANDPVARHLDAEIERMKAQLRETVEQYEASTEELKASNEELQAMNEELRAATEELETSREELQSINEELTTVNQELKSKVEQLSQANSDIQNLMDATQIATVFLDRELRIMRYTPAAVSLFNLIPSDIGRPLVHMATQLDYPELAADAARVLQRLVPVEREVGQADGNWYLARLMPYRTTDDRIAGLVFTFIDITERKRAEEVRRWLAAVVSSTSDGVISFSLDGTILSWNTGAQRLFGYGPEEAIGRSLALLSADGKPDARDVVDSVAAGEVRSSVPAVHRRKDGSYVHVAMTVSPVKDEAGHVLAGTAIVRDTTAERAAAEALRQSEERTRLIIENAREYAIFTLDLARRVTSWNPGAERLLGYAADEIIGRSGDVIFTGEDRDAKAPEMEAGLARKEGRASDDRTHIRRDGSLFPATGIMMLMRNDAGEAIGFVKILRDLSEKLPRPAA